MRSDPDDDAVRVALDGIPGTDRRHRPLVAAALADGWTASTLNRHLAAQSWESAERPGALLTDCLRNLPAPPKAKPPRPDKCDQCDDNRMRELPDGRVVRCQCHPGHGYRDRDLMARYGTKPPLRLAT